MESKQEIYDQIPDKYKPATFLTQPGETLLEVLNKSRKNGFGFPMILKPDIGMQGMAVYKITGENQLKKLLNQISVPFVVQPFIDYPQEIGVFYVRLPGVKRGRITGVVKKEFVSIVGDGLQTMGQLLMQTKRYQLQYAAISQLMGNELESILPQGEKKILIPFGNHARGALFLDVTEVYGPAILNTIEAVMDKIPDFYYGRMDIRYQSLEELANNQNWTIIELNGAGSEPTHMYDPKHSLFFAWKEIIRHWHYLYLISKANKGKGFKTMSYKEGLAMFRQHKQYQAKLIRHKAFDMQQNDGATTFQPGEISPALAS